MSVISPSNVTTPIQPGPSAAPDKPTAERIKSLAAQFESMLVGQMMQQMRASMFESGEGDDEKNAAPLADALFSELSLALSRAGGMGLADSFLAPLMRETGGAGTPSAMAAAAGIVAPGAIAPEAGAELPSAAAPFVSGRMSSAYGWRRDPIDDSVKFHRGVDIAMPVGNNVPAPQAGTVTAAGDVAGYGLTVVIDHGSFSTRYAHLSKIDVKPGDTVQQGQVIAQSGATGRVTGAHLHFEVLEAGQSVNPAAILPTYAAGGSQERN